MDKKFRKTIIAGNWKMNSVASVIPDWMDSLKGELCPGAGEEVVLCVPFPLIPAMLAAAEGSAVKTGAQDVSSHEIGAYTGEVNASMLSDLGARYCIIGHSERRAYHSESDELVNAKLRMLLSQGLTPIVCVGESLAQRDAGQTLDFVAEQVRGALAGIDGETVKGIVIAYEPIWAIGTGRTATAAQAQEVCAHIRSVLGQMYGEETSRGVSILYGGSMNAKNAAELLSEPDIDGGLIGGASLKWADFAAIVKAGNEDG